MDTSRKRPLHTTRRALAVMACALVAGSALSGAGPAAADASDPAASAIVEQYRQLPLVPAAYAVVDGEAVTYGGQGGAGPDTPFVIGSVSKSFTALAVLVAVERGELSLDDPVETHLPGLGLEWAGEPVRLRHLLAHTSGLDTATCNLDLTTPYASLSERVDDLRGHALSRPPGEQFEYCNVGYAVLARVLEVVSGRPFAEVLTTTVLRPLSLTGTRTDVADARANGLAEGRTTVLGFPIVRPEAVSASSLPDGHLISTVRDLATYARFQLGDGTTSSGARLVSAGLLAEAHAQAVAVPQGQGEQAGYGCGWFTGRVDGRPVVWHGGTTYRYQADIALLPGERRAVVSLAAGQWLAGTKSLTGAAINGLVARPATPSPLYPIVTTALWAAVLLLAATVAGSLAMARRRRRLGRRPRSWATALAVVAALAVPALFVLPALAQLGSLRAVVVWGWEAAPDLLVIEVAWISVLAWIAVRALSARRRGSQG